MRKLEVALSIGAVAMLTSPAAAQAPARPVFVNGQAQIVPAFADSSQWIRHRLWVETEFDSDGDGRRDRMHVDVTRPRQTDTEGLKVPVVYESSPYFAGTSGEKPYLWDVKQEVGAPPPPRTSQPAIRYQPDRTRIGNSEVATWVPRGFAVVHSEAPGTGLSQGCVAIGGPTEELAPKAVIDWLNGRARGYTTQDGMEEVVATSWSSGKVGMTGTSYNGTIPIAAALTGVQGLEAIIPIAPNTSYYHYYRSNGLVRHPFGWLGEDIDFLYDFVASGNPATRAKCAAAVRDDLFAKGRDREHGDYNAFWAERDQLNRVKNVRAATLMAHAFNDWNVVPEHSVRIYEALKKQGVPAQAYFHQGGHGGAPPLEMRNRWFTRYLYDVRNDVENDPRSFIVREGVPRGTAPVAYPDYPHPDAKAVELHIRKGGNAIGALTLDDGDGEGTERLVDDVTHSGHVLAQAEMSPNRLLYATGVLGHPVHISGYSTITIKLASSKPAANLSVWLVALPLGGGDNSAFDVITRGWADPQNHKALTKGGNFDSFDVGEPLVPRKFYEMTFSLQPDDQVIAAGKRIALMIFSSDRDFTLWPQPGTALTIDLDDTSIEIPVVGGRYALKRAIGN